MSAEKPEVGDVWEFAGKPIHIKEVTEDNEVFYVEEVIDYPMSTIETNWDSIEDFMDKCCYLGKSKANINDLFEVRNDEKI